MSSDDYAIRLSGLGKCHNIYAQPSDRLKQFVAPRAQRLLGRTPRQYFREFWALRDVSLDIRRGETVGIIGRNGSGKSTLLQILCGTLTPTTGTVDVQGRVAALLELGAGFNPEFTGRANVFMNAALLGVPQALVEERFDAIAAFADIGEFMDQPVKTYSSGMYVRLAFAVIAHVDADILVVDEALSVGDAVFTQKCMRFIRQFQERGTLLFVSHDMGAVRSLCETALWLGHGQVRALGPTQPVLGRYLQDTLQEVYGDEEQLEPLIETADAVEDPPPAAADDLGRQLREGPYGARYTMGGNADAATGFQTGKAWIDGAAFTLADDGIRPAVFEGGERVRLTLRAHTLVDLAQPILGFTVRDRLGQELFGENTLPFTQATQPQAAAGEAFHAEFVFTLPMLPNGQYALTVSVADGTQDNHVQHHWLNDIVLIEVASSKVRWGLVGLPFEQACLVIDGAWAGGPPP